MKDTEIIKEALKSVNWNQTQLAEALGLATQSAVSSRLTMNKSSMRVDTFVKFLNAMGYEVIVKSKNRDNKNMWVLDNNTQKED